MLKPPVFQLASRDPMGRRASDGGANIQLFLQEQNRKKLAAARGQSQLARPNNAVTISPPVVNEVDEVRKSLSFWGKCFSLMFVILCLAPTRTVCANRRIHQTNKGFQQTKI